MWQEEELAGKSLARHCWLEEGFWWLHLSGDWLVDSDEISSGDSHICPTKKDAIVVPHQQEAGGIMAGV